MKGAKGLREFCEDLASDEPAPGGGTASAAAGAMAASLLSMVCGVTLKSKKHEANWPRLASLRREADGLTRLLLEHAELDATAYATVVAASRAKRERPDDSSSLAAYEEAVRTAIDVPTANAAFCARVLRLAGEVSSVSTKSASSDIRVAVLLAAAGLDGAVANIMINLPYCGDATACARAKGRAEELTREKEELLARMR